MEDLKIDYDNSTANLECLAVANWTLYLLEKHKGWKEDYKKYREYIEQDREYSGQTLKWKENAIKVEPIISDNYQKDSDFDFKEFMSISRIKDRCSTIRCNGVDLVKVKRCKNNELMFTVIDKDNTSGTITIKKEVIGLKDKLIKRVSLNEKGKIYENISTIYEFAKQHKNLFKKGEKYIESRLITSFKEKNFGVKGFGIQPIMIPPDDCNMTFQFPTPLGASKIKKGELKYSGSQHGGGIDILARINTPDGIGDNNCIGVIELKDTPSKEKDEKYEKPEDVIKQAIAYTTFLASLINSDRDNDKKDAFWLNFFGKKQKVYKPKYVYYAVIAYPIKEGEEYKIKNADKDFANKTIRFTNGDEIELHYIFYNQNWEKNKELIKPNWISFIKKEKKK